MHRFVRSVRCAGIASVGFLTLLAGAVLVWMLVRPEMLPMLSTWHLAAILSSFVLPALCLAIWQADRRVAARLPRRHSAPTVTDQPHSKPSVAVAPVRAIPVAPMQASASSKPLVDRVGDRKAGAMALPPARTDAMAVRFSGDARRIHRHRRSVRV